jgi:uncharacterized membrane protein YebE (DUF533 family)
MELIDLFVKGAVKTAGGLSVLALAAISYEMYVKYQLRQQSRNKQKYDIYMTTNESESETHSDKKFDIVEVERDFKELF